MLLRGTEVARVLSVSRSLAYKWMSTGVLPVVRVEGCKTIRVPLAALHTWIAQNTQNPA
jgi:excisionase family DNA binding protein